jgi:hypothetical protein
MKPGIWGGCESEKRELYWDRLNNDVTNGDSTASNGRIIANNVGNIRLGYFYNRDINSELLTATCYTGRVRDSQNQCVEAGVDTFYYNLGATPTF